MKYNMLSPAQEERFDILQEEAGEIVVAIGKIKRHGLASFDPTKDIFTSNKQDLRDEVEQLIGCYLNMVEKGEALSLSMDRAKQSWQAKLRWCHHQDEGPKEVELPFQYLIGVHTAVARAILKDKGYKSTTTVQNMENNTYSVVAIVGDDKQRIILNADREGKIFEVVSDEPKKEPEIKGYPDFKYLIGMHYSEAEIQLWHERSMKLRGYFEDSIITADFREDRLNVKTDEKHIITEIVGIG